MGFFDYFKPKWKISKAISLRIFVVLFFFFLSILLVILLVTWTPRSVYIVIDELVAKCNAGDKDACGKLADIAKNDKADWMREYAVKKLANQVLLAEIALNPSEKDWVRSTAVENPNLTNQGLLTKIAKNDKSGWARKYAADKLDDKSLAQTVYADIMKSDDVSDLRRDVAHKLVDQVLLAEIADNDKSNFVRMAAADNLKDKHFAQSVYTDIAKNGTEKWVRHEAVKKLTDLLLLSDFAKNDKDRFVRLAAVQNPHFTDQELLGFIAMNDKDDSLPSFTVYKITNLTILTNIAENNKNHKTREAAKDRLKELQKK